MDENKLKSAFVKGLGLPATVDFQSLEFAKTEGWDSIAHMKLVAAIEEELGVRLGINDLLALSSYPKAVSILSKYDSPR